MDYFNLNQRYQVLIYGLSGSFLSCLLCLPSVGARMVTSGDRPASPSGRLTAQQSDVPDFSGEGRSGHRTGGGSRSDCPSVDVPLTALVPQSNIGDTITSYPTFWIYVPYTANQAPIGEFSLQDQERNDVYRAEFTLPAKPGLVSLTLPDTVSALPLNQDYRWYFNLYCSADKASSPIFVQGWVQRIAPTPLLEEQLADTPERPDIAYANNRVWFDAIAILANLRMASPDDEDLAEDWNALLNATGVNLDLPYSMPFVGSVNLEETADVLEPVAY